MTKRDRVGGWVKNGHFRRDVIMQWPLNKTPKYPMKLILLNFSGKPFQFSLSKRTKRMNWYYLDSANVLNSSMQLATN